MAITILTEPANPPGVGDYTRDQLIQQSNETPMLSILTDWESTATEPLAKQGAFIRHAGNTFQVDTADEAISGSPVAGLNYIIATESAGVITLAWATSIAGYTYNPVYGGIYNVSGNQALKDICSYDGVFYLRGTSLGQDHNIIYLSNGDLIFYGNILPSTYSSLGASVILNNGTIAIPKGIFYISDVNANEVNTNGEVIFSDGNTIFRNTTGVTKTYYLRRVG